LIKRLGTLQEHASLFKLILWTNTMFCIEIIEPDANHYNIRITYSDKIVVTAHFEELLEKGIMKLLKNPSIFNQVQIGNKGRSIVWKEQDIDFCADSLRFKFDSTQC